METLIPNLKSSSNAEKLSTCREALYELVPVFDMLIKAVKYYRSSHITKDQYRELQEINKYLDTHSILDDSFVCSSEEDDDSSCCSGEEEHVY